MLEVLHSFDTKFTPKSLTCLGALALDCMKGIIIKGGNKEYCMKGIINGEFKGFNPNVTLIPSLVCVPCLFQSINKSLSPVKPIRWPNDTVSPALSFFSFTKRLHPLVIT